MKYYLTFIPYLLKNTFYSMPDEPIGPWCKLRKRMIGMGQPLNFISRSITWCICVYCFWIGVQIVTGGAIRWGGPSYTYLLAIPGAPATWGYAIIFFGLLIALGLLTGQYTPKTFGLFLTSGWCLAFATGSQTAYSSLATAGNTGPPTYTLVSVTIALMIFTYERPPSCAPSKK